MTRCTTPGHSTRQWLPVASALPLPHRWGGLAMRLGELQAAQNAREIVEERYLAAHDALFPQLVKAWQGQRQSTDHIADLALRLGEMHDVPPALAPDPEQPPGGRPNLWPTLWRRPRPTRLRSSARANGRSASRRLGCGASWASSTSPLVSAPWALVNQAARPSPRRRRRSSGPEPARTLARRVRPGGTASYTSGASSRRSSRRSPPRCVPWPPARPRRTHANESPALGGRDRRAPRSTS